ncbi:hypothetical protein V1988_32380, partial [Pseudomonas aeruginosa]
MRWSSRAASLKVRRLKAKSGVKTFKGIAVLMALFLSFHGGRYAGCVDRRGTLSSSASRRGCSAAPAAGGTRY